MRSRPLSRCRLQVSPWSNTTSPPASGTIHWPPELRRSGSGSGQSSGTDLDRQGVAHQHDGGDQAIGGAGAPGPSASASAYAFLHGPIRQRADLRLRRSLFQADRRWPDHRDPSRGHPILMTIPKPPNWSFRRVWVRVAMSSFWHGRSRKIVDLARLMIRLAGRTERTADEPHGDIEIQFTGLRPGEKLSRNS